MKIYPKKNQAKNLQTENSLPADFSVSTQERDSPQATSSKVRKNLFPAKLTQNIPTKFLDLHWGFWLSVFIFFVILTIIFTWPLILNFNTKVPGTGNIEDRYRNLWNLWWIKQAFFNFTNPYQTTVLFYPYFDSNRPLPLYFHDLQLLNGLLTLPLQLLGSLATAYNGIIFFSFVASGVGAFALAFHLSHNKPASVFAGVFYTFNLEHLSAIDISTTNIMSTQYLPPYILFNLLWLEEKKKRYAIFAGLSLAASIYTDWYNTLSLVFYAVFYTFIKIFIILKKNNKLKEIFNLIFPSLIGIFLASPLIIFTYANLKNPLILPQLGINRDLRASLDLVTLFNLSLADSCLRLMVLISLGVVFFFLKKKTERKVFIFWSAFYLSCLIFTLGPELQLVPSENPELGGIPLPYLVLKFIPGFSVFRAPDRFIIPANLACGILLALTLNFIQQFLRRFPIEKKFTNLDLINISVILMFSFIYLSQIYPTSNRLNTVESFGFVKWLMQQPSGDLENYQLLELPITRHYQYDHTRMYNQIWHERPIMGGFLARPVIDPYRYSESPYNWLAQQRYYQQDFQKEIINEQLIFNILGNLALLDKYKYLVLYKEAYRYDWEYERIKQIVVNQFGITSLVYSDHQNDVYSLLKNSDNLQNLKPGIWLGSGFYDAETNQDGFYRWISKEANFYVISAQPQILHLKFDTLSFAQNRQMQIRANNQIIFDRVISNEQSEINIEYNLETPGIVQFEIKSLSGVQTPKELGYGIDDRSLSFLIKNLIIY